MKVVAGRILLPLALLAGCSIRINLVSFFYFTSLMIMPFVPTPTTRKIPWFTIKYTLFIMGVSLVALIVPLVFHICLLSTKPYGRDFIDCDFYEKIARQIGLQRFDSAYSYQIIRLICPELLVACASIITYRIYQKKTPDKKRKRSSGAKCSTDSTDKHSVAKKDSKLNLVLVTKPARTLTEHFLQAWRRFRASHFWSSFEKISLSVFACAAGIAHPNLVSFLYFSIFMLLVNSWLLDSSLRPSHLRLLTKALAIVSGLQLFFLYSYQFDFIQQLIDRRSIWARLFGLTAIFVTNCEDVRSLSINPDYRPPYALHFVALGILYRACANALCTDQPLCTPRSERRAVEKGVAVRAEVHSSFVRRFVNRTKRKNWMPKLIKKDSFWSNAKERNFAIEKRIAAENEATTDRNSAEEKKIEVEKPDKANFRNDEPKSRGVSISGLKRAISNVDFARRARTLTEQYCYVGCLLAMMTWSVTYHSWMTFMLLLLSCVIWMVPNPRRFCLRITPYLVCYAEALLIFQYIYGLELSENELPSETVPILHQAGFIKPNVCPACVHLFVKISYSVAFWLTFKAYLRERGRRDSSGQPGRVNPRDVESGFASLCFPCKKRNIAVHDDVYQRAAPKAEVEEFDDWKNEDGVLSHQIDSEKSGDGVEQTATSLRDQKRYFSSMQQDFLPRLVASLRKRIAQQWITICCVALLFISLHQQVVVYTIIYMGFLLTFVNLFLISFRLWRKFLHYFWTLMIVYCMCVLSIVYTYQFRKFPEMWHYGTGWSYDVLESLGLEQYSQGELLLKLLIPILFLICVIIQSKFFNQQLLDRTARLEKALSKAETNEKLEWNPSASPVRVSFARKDKNDEPTDPVDIGKLDPGDESRMSLTNANSGAVAIPTELLPHRLRAEPELPDFPSEAPSPDPKSISKEDHASSRWSLSIAAVPFSTVAATVWFQHGNNQGACAAISLPERQRWLVQLDKRGETTDDLKLEILGGGTSCGTETSNIEVDVANLLRTGVNNVLVFLRTNRTQIIELVWRFLEVHLPKAIAFQMMSISIQEVGAIHLPYPMFVGVMLLLTERSGTICKLASVWTSIVIFSKMVFQMKFVKAADAIVNCSSVADAVGAIYDSPLPTVRVADPMAWIGFHKSDNVTQHLQAYLLLMGLLILQELGRMRQTLNRAAGKIGTPPRGVLFERITRREADDGLISCSMYFANYVFYKFGLEICFVTTVATIGMRCDFVSFLYAAWLVLLLTQRRKRIARLWRFYAVFLAALIPLQYLACVGMPPIVCSNYPWSLVNSNLLEWLYLPDFASPPNATKLGADFIQLLFVACQMHVFEVELGPCQNIYPGGDNSELIEPLRIVAFKAGLKSALEACKELDEGCANSKNSTYEAPVADFISYPKSYLDLAKILTFEHLYWGTLTAIFVAGVSRVTLFAMGYVLAGFALLWVGNELFLKPLPFGLRLWDTLILYNAAIITMKISLQVIGCVFLDDLYRKYCWCLQLFGIACMQIGFDPAKVFDDKILADCKVPTSEASIIFDGICFGFLLAQRRVITSRYFTHVVMEFGAQHVFASRGADLIHKIGAKEIWERLTRENDLVMRIKRKMEKIKEAQTSTTRKSSIRHEEPVAGRKTHGHGQPAFEVDDEANDAAWELQLLDEKELVPEKEEDRRKALGPLQLLNIAFKKGDIKAAVEDAKDMEAKEAELEKKMTDSFGKPDKKAIRRALRKRTMSKVLPDFEEETFEADHISDLTGDENGSDNASEGNQSSFEIPENEEDGEAQDVEDAVERDQKFTMLVAETFVVKRLLAGWSALVEFLNSAVTFLKLFLNGVLESTIAWLLKISREYRYVAHVLGDEKNTFKSQQKLKLATLSRGPSLLSISGGRKIGGYRRGSGGAEKLKLNRGMNFYNRTLAEEEARRFNKDRNIFVRLLTSTYYVFLSRSELFCYLMMVLTHMASASLITMPLPMMAFVWGTLSVPQPTKRFWISVITYTEAIVIVKYVFQFGFFPWNKGVPPPNPFFLPRIMGIEQTDNYAAWDLALLMMLFFHRWNLKTLGLWKEKKDDDDEGSVRTKRCDARRRRSRLPSGGRYALHCARSRRMVPRAIPEEIASEENVDEETGEAIEDRSHSDDIDHKTFPKSPFAGRIRRHYRNMKNRWKKVKIRKWVWAQATATGSFFKVLINPRFRCAVDVYALMFLCDFICFAILIFGYSAFGTETSSGGIASYFEENKIPGPFVAMLVVQFILIIIDRALFLRKHLLGKVVYQIGLVVFIHIWIFFIMPAVTERQFVNNTPAKLWYFVKCIYFCLSAWQIRSGYPTRVLGNMLTKQYNIINMLLFKGFMMVPFLFELRALMDWIWTDTSMSLSDWLKLEDIYANIYQIKCARKMEEDYPTPRGVKKRPLLKYGWGGFLLFLMILIIWFPLVLFSLANTVGIRSPPVDVEVKLTLGTYPPLFQMHAPEQSMDALTKSEFKELQHEYRHSKLATAYMSEYAADDVIRVSFYGYSENVWSISPPARLNLIEDLNSSQVIVLRFEWHITREADGLGESNVVSDENLIELHPGHEIRQRLVRMLSGAGNQTTVDVPHLYPPYVKVPGKGRAAPVQALMMDRITGNFRSAYANTTLLLVQQDHSEYWKLSTISRSGESSDYLQMVGFVDKVFPATFNAIAGGGILGLYVSLVLVAGNFIRNLVTGGMSKIMFEDLPNVDRILQLCLDIFLVREAGELSLEEDLFAKLIFIYRSPATLIKWTKMKNIR